MTSNSTNSPALGSDAEIAVGLLHEWFDPIEAGLRDRVREFIQTMIESELEAVLSRPRYARRPQADPENNCAGGVPRDPHGHRPLSLLGTVRRVDVAVARVRLDRRATSIVLLVVLGVRQDGQKVLLAVKNMGGETSQAWRAVLDDLVKRELRQPEFLIVDGGTGLEQALAALWGDVPTQRCTVHKHRNLLAHAPPRLHDDVPADYNDIIYPPSPPEIEQRRRACLRKWRLKGKAVSDSLEQAGDRLFTVTRLPPTQWEIA